MVLFPGLVFTDCGSEVDFFLFFWAPVLGPEALALYALSVPKPSALGILSVL